LGILRKNLRSPSESSVSQYLGAPVVEEGDFQGLLDAIDVVVEKHPQYLLHGHEPLTLGIGDVGQWSASTSGESGCTSRASSNAPRTQANAAGRELAVAAGAGCQDVMSFSVNRITSKGNEDYSP
jgi:hypothetical protein